MKTIVITGAECSGKTTLAEQLAGHYKTNFCQEYARTFLENLNRKYTYTDIENLAKEQEAIQASVPNKGNNISILDTDLLTLKIWMHDKFHQYPRWFDKALKVHFEARMYILCSPEIPYKVDPLREDEFRRFEIFKIYKSELKKLNANYFVVEGSKTERLEQCISLIKNHSSTG